MPKNKEKINRENNKTRFRFIRIVSSEIPSQKQEKIEESLFYVKIVKTLHSRTSPAKTHIKPHLRFSNSIIDLREICENEKENDLLGIKRIETDGNTRFNLCLKEQRSIQQRATAAAINGAPIKAKSNPADINPLHNSTQNPQLNTLTHTKPTAPLPLAAQSNNKE